MRWRGREGKGRQEALQIQDEKEHRKGFQVPDFGLLPANKKDLVYDAVCERLLAASPELGHALTAKFPALQGNSWLSRYLCWAFEASITPTLQGI